MQDCCGEAGAFFGQGNDTAVFLRSAEQLEQRTFAASVAANQTELPVCKETSSKTVSALPGQPKVKCEMTSIVIKSYTSFCSALQNKNGRRKVFKLPWPFSVGDRVSDIEKGRASLRKLPEGGTKGHKSPSMCTSIN